MTVTNALSSSTGSISLYFNGGDLTLGPGVGLQAGDAVSLHSTGGYAIAAGPGGSVRSTAGAVTLSKALTVTRAVAGTASTYEIKAETALSLAAVTVSGETSGRSDGTTLLLVKAGTVALTGAVSAAHATDEVQLSPTCQATGSTAGAATFRSQR